MCAGRSAGVWGPPRNDRSRSAGAARRYAGVRAGARLCHDRGQPVTVHGGLTGVVDGALADSGDVVLSLERLTGVEAIDPLGGTMLVQAGTTLQAVQEAAEEHG